MSHSVTREAAISSKLLAQYPSCSYDPHSYCTNEQTPLLTPCATSFPLKF